MRAPETGCLVLELRQEVGTSRWSVNFKQVLDCVRGENLIAGLVMNVVVESKIEFKKKFQGAVKALNTKACQHAWAPTSHSLDKRKRRLQ